MLPTLYPLAADRYNGHERQLTVHYITEPTFRVNSVKRTGFHNPADVE